MPNTTHSVSRYNTISETAQHCVAFNARTGTFIKLNEQAFAVLKGIKPIEELTFDDCKELENGGFIVNFDELKAIQSAAFLEKKSLGICSHLVITPTIKCNFRCPYCDQNNMRSATSMTEETLDAIASIFKQKNDLINIEMVTWYGGEPLLEIDKIERFLRGSGAFLNSKNIRQIMITNATLLTKKVVERLISLNIMTVQVTIDALVYINGLKRGAILANHDPSPIMINLLEAERAGLNVIARINVDENTATKIPEIRSALKKNGFVGTIYEERVESFNEDRNEKDRVSSSCSKILPSSSTVDRAAYAEQIKAAMLSRNNIKNTMNQLKPKFHTCGATKLSMLVCSPDGNVSRCWNSVGLNDESFANINDNDFLTKLDSDLESSVWAKYSPLKHDDCATCKMLPLCMGACSYSRNMLGSDEPPCPSLKFIFPEVVDHISQRLDFE